MSELTSPSPALTQLAHGGGCGCKIAPGVLSDILSRHTPGLVPPELMVGIETSDDAAVWRLNDTQALVATTDFFTPIVDDPFDFGRIAATNALSDVYAMGGQPIMALAIVGMPIGKLAPEVIGRILEGGASVCRDAGIPIAGGHSIDVVEPIYGLVALGLVHPSRVRRNADARAGDVLVLGKPLGVGVLSAALKRGQLDAAGYAEMLRHTTQLNRVGTALADLDAVHAITDVPHKRHGRDGLGNGHRQSQLFAHRDRGAFRQHLLSHRQSWAIHIPKQIYPRRDKVADHTCDTHKFQADGDVPTYLSQEALFLFARSLASLRQKGGALFSSLSQQHRIVVIDRSHDIAISEKVVKGF